MSRKKLFIENFLAYGAINALDKIVPVIMLPIVTRLITDSADYGKFEMFNTIVSFGSSFAVLGVYDAMFREYFERDEIEYKNIVTSTAARIVFFSAIVFSCVLFLGCRILSDLFLGSPEDWHIVVMAAIGVFLAANRAIISAPTRMKNQRKVYVFSGLSYSLLYYMTAIVLIKQGFNYYGLIIGNIAASLYLLLFFYILNRKDFIFSLFNKNVAKELLKIGIPLVPCFVIYWAFNSMDRIMIAHMLGLQEVGIYSIGAKVASVSTFIYAAFAGGWQYFAFSTMKDNDQVAMTSKIFEYLGVLSFVALSFAMLIAPYVFDFFFSGDYTKGIAVFPYLFLSPLILMLFQTAGNQLLVVKKAYLSTGCLLAGLCCNLILNYLLIPAYGIKGAAAATLVGFIVSVIMVLAITIKMQLMAISMRFVCFSLITMAMLALDFSVISCSVYMQTIVTFSAAVLLYHKDFLVMTKRGEEHDDSN